jgi:hypothetical protein
MTILVVVVIVLLEQTLQLAIVNRMIQTLVGVDVPQTTVIVKPTKTVNRMILLHL